jgi:hypothetical protein
MGGSPQVEANDPSVRRPPVLLSPPGYAMRRKGLVMNHNTLRLLYREEGLRRHRRRPRTGSLPDRAKAVRRAATIYTLVQTAELNGIDPQAWLADVLARIADRPHGAGACRSARPRGHRVQAPGCALCRRPVRRLGEGEEPGQPGRAARGGGGLDSGRRARR